MKPCSSCATVNFGFKLRTPTRTYAYRPDVTIVESAGRGYEMSIEGVDESIAVAQIHEFMKTCIEGEFEGFELGIVFQLCNGQVWEQSSAWYWYTYHPDVLICRAPSGGYRMTVESVDHTISVVRPR